MKEAGNHTPPDQLWAEPDLAHARQLMRQVFKDRKDAAKKDVD